MTTEPRPTLYDVGVDPRRYGYFVHPFPRDDPRVLAGPEAPRWFELQDGLAGLVRGDFSALPALLKCVRHSRDWRLKSAALRVLGDAGTVECFRDMRAELEQGSREGPFDVASRELVLLYCRAFAAWGRLDVVPVLLDQYLRLRLASTPEIALLPLLIAQLLADRRGDMLAHEPPEEHIEDYLNLVMERYESVVQALGSDKALVFRGALQSVRGLAERIRHPTTRYVSVELVTLRERFEPATGIDCSEIFADGVDTFAAAALAERFLDAPEAARFDDGVRYFFGHRVPT